MKNKKRNKITYRRLSTGNYQGRCSSYYIFIYARKHYVREGFEKFEQWYTAYITKDKKCVAIEGVHGSYLRTISFTKKWVKTKLKSLEQ